MKTWSIFVEINREWHEEIYDDHGFAKYKLEQYHKEGKRARIISNFGIKRKFKDG